MRGLVRRVAVVVLALGLAILAGLHAEVGAIARADPDVALGLDPSDAVALVTRADRGLAQDDRIDSIGLSGSASRALLSAPLSSGALRQLGLAADQTGKRDRARKLMAMSQRVSRRDSLTQIWMIEDRVAAGDIAGALDHYDLALSTSDEAANVLFPVLDAALENSQVSAAFAPLLGKSRPWMSSFLDYAIANSVRPQDLAAILIANGGLPPGAGYAALAPKMLTRLAATGQYFVAYRYAVSLRGARARALTEFGFSDATLDPKLTPLTWQLADDSNVRARKDVGDRIAVSAGSNARGTVASRVLFVRPGTYWFGETVTPLPQAESALLTWELRCLSPEAADPIWRQEVPATASERRYRSSVAIPEQCRVQQLSLIVSGTDTQVEAGARVGQLTLKSAGR